MKKNQKPTVSVVMVVQNEERFVIEAIESIRKQTRADFEFIIIDDASTDGTHTILTDYARKDSRIILMTNIRSLPLVASLNKGVERAQGTFIARMDGDDVAHPRRFELQIDYLEKNNSHALVGTWYHEINEKGGYIQSICFPCSPDKIKDALVRYNPFMHSSIMVRRNILNELGNYDQDFTLAEDYELYFRVAKHYKMQNLPLFLMARRITLSSITHQRWRGVAYCTLKVRLRAINKREYAITIPLLLQSYAALTLPPIVRKLYKKIFPREYQCSVPTHKSFFWDTK